MIIVNERDNIEQKEGLVKGTTVIMNVYVVKLN